MKSSTKLIGIFVILIVFSMNAWALSDVLNFPNPFNPKSSDTSINKTTISYKLDKDSKVTIYIYTKTGDLVRKMEFESGVEGGKGALGGYTNRISWNGHNGDGMIVANGTYICRIVAEPNDGSDTFKEIRKIAIVK